MKGRATLLVDDILNGGWGFNLDNYYEFINVADVWNANNIPDLPLKTAPFFGKNPNNPFLYTDGSVFLSEVKIEELLANEIPALTFAAGHRGILPFNATNRNIDMRQRYVIDKKVPWVRPASTWMHSDIFEVSYPYVHGVYEDWFKVMKGELK